MVNKNIKLLILIGMFVIFSVFFIFISSKNSKGYGINSNIEIVILADRNNPRERNGVYEEKKQKAQKRSIDFIGVNCIDDKKNSILTYPYPYVEIESTDYPTLRNLVGNKDGNLFWFVNPGDKQGEYITLEIKKEYPKTAYEISKTTSSAVSKIRSLVNWQKSEKAIEKKYEITINPGKTIVGSNFEDSRFTNLDSYGDRIMMNNGLTIQTYRGTVFPSYKTCFLESSFEYNEKKVILKDVIFDFPYIFGAIFLDDKTIIYQAPGKEEKNTIDKLKDNINVLLFYSPDGSKNRIIESGFSPITPVYVENHICPMDISPDRKKIAFISRYSDKSKNPPKLWLSIWNMETDTVEKILPLNASLVLDTLITWCPGDNSQLIAFVSVDSFDIIDIKKKKIVRSFRKVNIKSARWSPDGNRIAFLSHTKYVVTDNIMPKLKAENPASLWIFDVKNNKLEHMAEDADYFDFFWVK